MPQPTWKALENGAAGSMAGYGTMPLMAAAIMTYAAALVSRELMMPHGTSLMVDASIVRHMHSGRSSSGGVGVAGVCGCASSSVRPCIQLHRIRKITSPAPLCTNTVVGVVQDASRCIALHRRIAPMSNLCHTKRTACTPPCGRVALLRRHRHCVEADVGEEHHRGAAKHAARAVRREGVVVGRLHKDEAWQGYVRHRRTCQA